MKESVKIVSYVNPDSIKELKLEIDKKMIFVYGKNGTGKTTLSKSNDLNSKLVFNEDFIHNNVYIIDGDGAKIDASIKNNFSGLLIGADVVSLRKEQQIFEQLLKDVLTRQKDLNAIITELFLQNQIAKETNPLESIIDENFSYDLDKTLEEQIETYKSSYPFEQSITNDEMLENYVNQIKQQATLSDLINKIKQNKLLNEYLFTNDDANIAGLNTQLLIIKERKDVIKELEELALDKKVDKSKFGLIKDIIELQCEINLQECILCGNPEYKKGLEDWKKIILDDSVMKKEQLKKEINSYIKDASRILESREMYEIIAPKTIKNIVYFVEKLEKVLASLDLDDVIVLQLEEKEEENLMLDLNDKILQIAKYLVKDYKDKIIYLNSSINYFNQRITEKKKEIEDNLKENADVHTSSINNILAKLGLEKEIKVKIDRAGGQIKYSLEVNSSDISKLSDGQKHKVALAVFLNSIKNIDLTNQIIMFDDPMVAMDEYTYHLFKNYLVTELMTNDEHCPTLIIATHNFSYLYVQISNIITNEKLQADTKIVKLYSDKIKNMNIELFKLDDLALFKKAVTCVSHDDQLINLSSLYNKIFREFLDLKLRLLGEPLNGDPKIEIEALNLDEEQSQILKRNNSAICNCAKDLNANLNMAKEAFSLLVESIQILGFDYLSQEDINRINDIADEEKEYEKNDIDIIISEISQILRNTEVDKKYQNYINHPRISFTKNTLSTSMDI